LAVNVFNQLEKMYSVSDSNNIVPLYAVIIKVVVWPLLFLLEEFLNLYSYILYIERVGRIT